MTQITSITQPVGEDAADHADDPDYLNNSIDDDSEKVVQQWEQFSTATLFHEDHAKEAEGAFQIVPKLIMTSKVVKMLGKPNDGKTVRAISWGLEYAKAGGTVRFLQADEGHELTARHWRQAAEYPTYQIQHLDIVEDGVREFWKHTRRVVRLFQRASNKKVRESLRRRMGLDGALVIMDYDACFTDLNNQHEVQEHGDLLKKMAGFCNSAILILGHVNKHDKAISATEFEMIYQGVADVEKKLDGMFMITAKQEGRELVQSFVCKKARFGGLRKGDQVCTYRTNLDTLEGARTDYIDIDHEASLRIIKEQDKPTVNAFLRLLETKDAIQSELLDFVQKRREAEVSTHGTSQIYGGRRARQVLLKDIYRNTQGYWREQRVPTANNTIIYSIYTRPSEGA